MIAVQHIAAIVAAMPGVVSVIRIALVVGHAVIPVAGPVSPAPVTAGAGAERNPAFKRQSIPSNRVRGIVIRRLYGDPVDECWVVTGHVNDQRISRLKSDYISGGLRDKQLPTCLDIFLRLGLGAQQL